jgi:hypothetical protein
MKQNNLTKQNNFTSFPKRLKRMKLINQNNFTTFPKTDETDETK